MGSNGQTGAGSGAHRVVIIGAGFGGLFAARRLKGELVTVTVIDRTTHHLFAPLLYQVATGILSEGEIAPPTRDVLRHQSNATVLLGEVTDVDLDAHTVTSRAGTRELTTPYDSLIVAAGAETSYFGHDEIARHAPSLKDIDDALEVRGRIFGAFEMAELDEDPTARGLWMTFVVVGAGATGVELAGQIAELSRNTLKSNFRRIDPANARIVLIDSGPRILGQFHERLAHRAAERLRRLGVEIELGIRVAAIDEGGVDLIAADGTASRIKARTKVWAAGVQASPLAAVLADASGVALGHGGRLPVNADCSVPGHPEVFVVGDMMELDGLGGVAEVALQSGRHAARQIVRRLGGEVVPEPFHYRDLGSLASISKSFAVAELGPMRMAGRSAWLLWLFVHLASLTGFKNRITTVFHWALSFLGHGRAERTITLRQVLARQLPASAEAEPRS